MHAESLFRVLRQPGFNLEFERIEPGCYASDELFSLFVGLDLL